MMSAMASLTLPPANDSEDAKAELLDRVFFALFLDRTFSAYDHG